jgi:hypothetical protein
VEEKFVNVAVRDISVTDRRAGRYVYLTTAALFIAVTLIGFVPTSTAYLSAIRSGAAPPPPLLLHLHALVMWGWLLLFSAQATLFVTGRRQLHQSLGLASLLLAPAMVFMMIAVTIQGVTRSVGLGYGDAAAKFLALQIQDIILFALFYCWAVAARRSAPETHKRMMVLATFAILNAAIGRMTWLPFNIQPNLLYDLAPLYQLLLLVPVLVHDVVRLGRLHSSYIYGLAIFAVFVGVTRFLWYSPWWLETAPALMGVK